MESAPYLRKSAHGEKNNGDLSRPIGRKWYLRSGRKRDPAETGIRVSLEWMAEGFTFDKC